MEHSVFADDATTTRAVLVTGARVAVSGASDDAERAELLRTKFGNAELKEPDEVADAVLHALSSDRPKRRYMVTPNEEQARLTINAALQRLLELNEDQPYSYDRNQLAALLDELLEKQKTKP